MPENKQYIIQTLDNGSVCISEEVIASIVINSLKDVDGIIGIGGKPGFDLASIRNWVKTLQITFNENNGLSIDCNVIVSYGQSVIEIAKQAQDTIFAAVESMAGVKPASVNVRVCGIAQQ
jgi:uncharacterized alkaline shock family protein YloU